MPKRRTEAGEVKEILDATGLTSGEGLQAMLELSSRMARDNAELSKEKRGKFWFLFKVEPDGTVKALFGVDP